jgi:hypothetical protein
MSRICSACGTVVARKECHKNRYGEYICRECQSAGIKFVRQRQPGNPMRLVIQVFLFGFAVASLLFLVTWQFFLDSGSVPAIGGAYDAVIDTSGGTLLNPPVNAQRVEDPGQAVPEANSQIP